MLEGLVQPIARAVESAVARYATWAAVAVLFFIAGGFATAAITIKLTELYGALTAYSFIAGGFALLGLVVAVIARIVLSRPAVESTQPAAAQASAEGEENTQSELPIPPDVVMAAFSSAAPVAAPLVIRSVLRNLPLLIILAVAAYLFSLTGRDMQASEPATAQ